MPYRKIAAEALAMWREADRRLAELEPSAPEWEAAYLRREAARARYQEAVEAARAEHLPEPPPFEEGRAEA
jgi:hypothetical protein